jgi:hypothetical protein
MSPWLQGQTIGCPCWIWEAVARAKAGGQVCRAAVVQIPSPHLSPDFQKEDTDSCLWGGAEPVGSVPAWKGRCGE